MCTLFAILSLIVGDPIQYKGVTYEREAFMRKCRPLNLKFWDKKSKELLGEAVAVGGMLETTDEPDHYKINFLNKGVVKATAPAQFEVDPSGLKAGMGVRAFGIVDEDADHHPLILVKAWEVPAPEVVIEDFVVLAPDRPLERAETFEVVGIVHNTDPVFPARDVKIKVVLNKGNGSKSEVITVDSLSPGEQKRVSTLVTVTTRRNQGSNRLPTLAVHLEGQAKTTTDQATPINKKSKKGK